jgi:hypothetical protein
MRSLSGGRSPTKPTRRVVLQVPPGDRTSSSTSRPSSRRSAQGALPRSAAAAAAAAAADAGAAGAASGGEPAPPRPARDLPFLPDEDSWLRDPNNVRGLRSVSVRMCHLLRQKRTCTCSEVADQLTEESQAAAERESAAAEASASGAAPVPEKNLRRRIYDALNVLASAGVVQKDGEVVHWRGLPDHIEVSALQAEKRQLQLRIAKKKRVAEEIQEKRAAFEALLTRNRDPAFSQRNEKRTRLSMPFVSIVTDKHTQIERVERPGGVGSAESRAGNAEAAAASSEAAGVAASADGGSAAAHSAQQEPRRSTWSVSEPAVQTEALSEVAAAAAAVAVAPQTVVYEISGKFRLQDDADVLKQMVRAGALQPRRRMPELTAAAEVF